MWTKWGKPYSKIYKIFDEKSYCEWWDNYKDYYSRKQIYEAMRNLAYAVREGHYEERYISNDPGKFLMGNMIDRGLSDEIRWVYESDHPGFSNPNSEYYDKNYDIFKDDG